MKKLQIVLTLIIFALMGCNILGSEDSAKKERREVHWGLRLQIGNYVLDSIFPPEGWNSNEFYAVSMLDICTTEPNCRTSPHIGKIYGWDNECFDSVIVTSPIGDGYKIPVDPQTAEFDFSRVNLEVQGGISYRIMPQFKPDSLSQYDCYSNDFTIMSVFFNYY